MTEKFITPEPLPNERQREILHCLIEECAEIQHRACKALRFGLAEVEPDQGYTNIERLSVEVGELLTVADMAALEGVLDSWYMAAGGVDKKDKLARYMQTEPPA